MGSQSEDDAMGDEVYQPEGLDDREDEGILDAEDTLEDRGADPYDEGWSPPERPLGVEHQGITEREQREGETLDERLAEERRDPALEEPDAADDGVGDLEDGAGEPLDGEVGGDRAGRLVGYDGDALEDAENDMLAEDVGIDGAAASAEEAAVHLVPDDVPEVPQDDGLRQAPQDEVRRLRSEADGGA
ncbi:DUF5709 domain-containing protein [Streptomyces sp. NPDC048566]|uniref:DUF5709 domain-containing protein n=1 Tax=Streptomyces sp. NPDC048566 TaxID=3365569 RepID=UPI00371B6A03